MTLRTVILGSAAGGRVPQWNCGCPNCVDARAMTGRVVTRTQDSLAISPDGHSWVLCNASPDIAEQFLQNPSLWPSVPRGTPVRAIVLTNGDVDHIVGLFSLRESERLAIYATEVVWAGLRANVLVHTLQRFPGQLVYRRLPLGHRVELEDPTGNALGIAVVAMPMPGKRPVHLELGAIGPTSEEDNVALFLYGAGERCLAYIPATARAEVVRECIEAHHPSTACLLLDGTFWTDDELVRPGLGSAHASSMAHIPISGPGGSLDVLSVLRVPRKVFTHINNTNPILREDSDERRQVIDAGWEVAYDGMAVST